MSMVSWQVPGYATGAGQSFTSRCSVWNGSRPMSSLDVTPVSKAFHSWCPIAVSTPDRPWLSERYRSGRWFVRIASASFRGRRNSARTGKSWFSWDTGLNSVGRERSNRSAQPCLCMKPFEAKPSGVARLRCLFSKAIPRLFEHMGRKEKYE